MSGQSQPGFRGTGAGDHVPAIFGQERVARTARWAVCVAVGLAVGTATATWAQSATSVQYAGRMGDRALLVIDGQPRTLAVGDRQGGVKLLAVESSTVRVERDGVVLTLRLGGTPSDVGSGPRLTGGREIVLSADAAGHFTAEGAINGRVTRFLVDTGATALTLSQTEADRLQLDWRRAPRAQATTANGAVPAHVLSLTSVRVGEVTVSGVPAIVLPAQLPYVLLGNTFLNRFQMQRNGETMRLELRP